MNFNELVDLADEVVKRVERVGSEHGATGEEKRATAVEVVARHVAEEVNDAVRLPALVERHTPQAVGMAVDLMVHFYNKHLGPRWGSRVDLSQEGKYTRLTYEIKF